MSVYRDCPFAYMLYKQRKDAMFFNPDVMDSGKYVHDSVDKYYKYRYLTHGTENDILFETYNVLKTIWDTFLPIEELQKAYICLTNHAKWEAHNINNGISTKPLTEVELSTDVFYGIIDYVNLNNNMVIDWKTGRNAYLSFEYRMQAYIYKLLFEKNYGIKLDAFTFFFLYPNEFLTVKFDDKKMEKPMEEVDRLQAEIVKAWEENNFPKQPRTESQCCGCEYRIYCLY